MCGFAAMLAGGEGVVERSVVERMTHAIAHRGRDDSGSYYSDPIGFGFRRLSILDLTAAGHQPMSSPDEACTLVFNGEVYNYRELRRELESLGHVFRSTGDTEVVLCAYMQWGADCLHRFNGMWAFLIHDKRRGKLFGARDRFGIKPLFRYRAADCWLFGSEIKAIRASGLCDAEINWSTATNFLMSGELDTTTQTFYSGIESVSPATAFEIDCFDGACCEWRYWHLEDAPPMDSNDPASEFAELFEDAIRLHMRSDVPAAVHLSGGLDSTSIICSTARQRLSLKASGRLRAYSYQEEEFDESSRIADTVAQTEAVMSGLETSPLAVWDDLGKMLMYQDEPVHSMTAVIGYQLMQLTASHGLKVVLNGQGADETLAGYPSYFRDYWNTLIGGGRVHETWREIGKYVAVHGGQQSQLFLQQLRHLFQGKLRSIVGYRRLASWNERRRLHNDDWFDAGLAGNISRRRSVGGNPDLSGALSHSISVNPLPLYLRVEDRNSMAHSVEARVPFLDHRLVSFAYRLPANWKMRGPWNKFVLREAMRGRIPERVRQHPVKFGFPVPAAKWFRGPLYDAIREQITCRDARERGIYNMDNIVRDLERHRRGELDVSAKLFRIAQFEVWSSL